MPFLPGQEIRTQREHLFDAGTYDDTAIDKAAYNLRLGNEVFISTEDKPTLLTPEDPLVVLKPGEFALLKTHEIVTLSQNLLGFITLRHTFKKHGLLNVSGFHVDPGFRGRLVFSVFNVGPNDVVLRYLEKVFMIFFATVVPATEIDVAHRHQNQQSFSLEDMMAIRGRSASLVHIESRIREIEGNVRFYGAIVAGVLLALFALVVGLVLKT